MHTDKDQNKIEKNSATIYDSYHGQLLHPGLIGTTFTDITHPLDGVTVIVVQLGLKDLQVAYLESRARKGDLDKE